MANFEAFCQTKKLIPNLFFLKKSYQIKSGTIRMDPNFNLSSFFLESEGGTKLQGVKTRSFIEQ